MEEAKEGKDQINNVLTKCDDCGKEVSRSAVACPHCGGIDPATPAYIKKQRAIIFFVVAVVLILLLANAWSDFNAKKQEALQGMDQAIQEIEHAQKEMREKFK